MTTYIQETDSKMIFPLFPKLTFNYPAEAENQTIGGVIIPNFLPLNIEANIIDNAFDVIHSIGDQIIAEEANKLLLTIQTTIEKFQSYRSDLYSLPQLHAFPVDDGSLLIEWIFTDFRIGFSIEPDNNESSWYLVANRKYGDINASGYLADIDTQKIILWLINFILVNS
jgi:hypothetical protein